MGSESLKDGNLGLHIPELERGLRHSLFGGNICYRESIASTNTLAKEHGSKGAPEGTLVLTDLQTGGRGRLGRHWDSPKYQNLLFSVLLRPPIRPEKVFGLTMIFALAAMEGIASVSDLRPMIKWPNDIYVNGKKLAGILTELSVTEMNVDYVVLGLGINVNWYPEHSEQPLYKATSMALETGQFVGREDLLVSILTRFERHYRGILSGDAEKYRRAWNARSMVLGKQVVVEVGQDLVKGFGERIDSEGALILIDARGRERRIICGDVSVKAIENG